MTNIQYTAVITACRRENLLRRALLSVVSQTLPASQILITDDGGSAKRIGALTERFWKENHQQTARLPAPVVLANDGHGISAARNTAIRLADFEWIAFLDDDDEWLPDKNFSQARALTMPTEHGAIKSIKNIKNDTGQSTGKHTYRLCHTNEAWLRNGSPLNQLAKHRKSGGQIYERCLSMCRVSPSSVFLHRTLFKDYGLFDEKLPVCEDYDMWLRICAYEEVLYLPAPLVIKHGGHANQLSRKYWGIDRFRMRALAKMMQDRRLPADKRNATRQMLIEKIGILANGAQKRGKLRAYKFYKNRLEYWRDTTHRAVY